MNRKKHLNIHPQSRRTSKVYTYLTNESAFTIVELIVVVVIIGILASISFFVYSKFIDQAKVISAISEIKNLASDIKIETLDGDPLPVQNPPGDIGDVFSNQADNIDPWGRQYQYSSPPTRTSPTVPPPGLINTEYDIYSLGKDGVVSLDDIVRAGDGQYIGKASGY